MAAAAAAALTDMEIVRKALEKIGFDDSVQGPPHNTRPTVNFVECLGVEKIEDFLEFDPKKPHRAIEAYDAHQDCKYVISHLQAVRFGKLLHWCRDRDNQGLALDPNAITTQALNDAVKREKIYESYDETKSSKMHKFNKDDPQGWFNTTDNSLKSRPSVILGVCINYLTRLALPAGQAPANEEEARRHRIPLTGVDFDADNKQLSVWLVAACAGTDAKEWFEPLEETNDGRGMYEVA